MEGYEHLLLQNVWMEIFYRKRFLWPLEDAFSALCLSLRIPSFYIDACLHTCPGDARFSIVCSFFLEYSRNYQSVSFMTLFSCWFNRKTLFICNQLISIHKALTRPAQRCYFGKYIPVGIPRIFDPRPKPLITGPPIYHGSIGSAPPIPGIQQYKSMLL